MPIKAGAGKSGGGALKTIELATGDLLDVVDTRLERGATPFERAAEVSEGKVISEIGMKIRTTGGK